MADVFKKYSSIENAKPMLVQKVHEFLVENGQIEKPWAAMEKVDGANFQFAVSSDREIICSSRNRILGPTDSFFNFHDLKKRYQEKVLAAYDEVVKYAEQSRFLEETKNEDAPEEGVVVAEGATAAEVDEDPDNEFSNATTKHLNEGEVVMRLYGELFGGGYPTNPESFERGKTKINLSSAVQKRILYLPCHGFYLFDVVCETKIGGRVYFGMQEMVDLGEKCGFQFIAKPLHVDTFDNLLKLNPEFLTTIPSVAEPPLGEIKGNIAEGYVLRPMVNIKYKNSRLIFKLKHPEFSETAVLDKAQKEAKKMAFNATEVEKVVPFVMACMTTNRVGNISSHYDPAVFTAIPQGKLTFLLIQDAIKELIRENEEFAEMYNPKSFGQVKKAVEKEATAAIKAYQEEEQET